MALDGLVCVVLGASTSTGVSVSKQIASRGGRMVIACRDSRKLNPLAEETGSIAFVADATDPAQVDLVFEEAMERFGRVDAAVNCISTALSKPAHLTSPREWRDVIAANLDSSFYTIGAAVKAMSGSGSIGGSVALCSSVFVRDCYSNHEAIAAAKAGMIGLALCAAASYSPRGIRINCVTPGLNRSPLTPCTIGSKPCLLSSLEAHACTKINEQSDAASAVAWLLDPMQRNVTGQVISVLGDHDN